MKNDPLQTMLSRALNQPRPRYEAESGRIIFPEEKPVVKSRRKPLYLVAFITHAFYRHRQVEKEFEDLEAAVLWMNEKAKRCNRRFNHWNPKVFFIKRNPWQRIQLIKIHKDASLSETTTLFTYEFYI